KDLSHDLTLIAYEGEEVATEFNGLGHLQRDNPQWLQGDLALLGEPSGAMIEAGCQGTIRLRVTAHGTRAHSARAWLGSNAVHTLTPVMTKIADYSPRDVTIDGCTYREGLNIVHLEAGVATNTLPDHAWMFVNFRFAPDRSSEEAMEHLLDVLGLAKEQEMPADATLDSPGISFEVDDVAGAARRGLGPPAGGAVRDAAGGSGRAECGWTAVAGRSGRGTPAVTRGRGDAACRRTRAAQSPGEQVTSRSQARRPEL